MNDSITQQISKITAGTIVKAFLGILAILGTLFALDGYLDGKIEDKIRTDAFVDKVASRIRPFAIFNSDGAILYDDGAMQFLDSIEVTPAKKEGDPVMTIVVNPKQHLDHAPLIEALGFNAFSQKNTRGKGEQWIIELGVRGFQFAERPAEFRIEILR